MQGNFDYQELSDLPEDVRTREYRVGLSINVAASLKEKTNHKTKIFNSIYTELEFD